MNCELFQHNTERFSWTFNTLETDNNKYNCQETLQMTDKNKLQYSVPNAVVTQSNRFITKYDIQFFGQCVPEK